MAPQFICAVVLGPNGPTVAVPIQRMTWRRPCRLREGDRTTPMDDRAIAKLIDMATAPYETPLVRYDPPFSVLKPTLLRESDGTGYH